jgi:hypothetical protein
MREPLVRIRLDGNGRIYCPGETLAGSYRMEGIAPPDVRAIEVSVLWHTEGKGDEDLAVHDFRRLSVENGDAINPRHPGRFSAVLPNSPLSYRGVIVKIRWCVRVRVFLARGREVVGEVHFRLGEVLPPRSATFWARARSTSDLLAEAEPADVDAVPGVSDEGPMLRDETASPTDEGPHLGDEIASTSDEIPVASAPQPDEAPAEHSSAVL